MKRLWILIVFYAFGIVGSLKAIVIDHSKLIIFGTIVSQPTILVWNVAQLILAFLIIVGFLRKKKIAWVLAYLEVGTAIASGLISVIIVSERQLSVVYPSVSIPLATYKMLQVIGVLISCIVLGLLISTQKLVENKHKA
ncbi:MAG: hypothetical protein ACREH5_04335 [Candidatus Omnitrophota bacterium]